MSDIISEARTQQDIWKQTFLTHGGEIAPSIGNKTILEGKNVINKLLDNLRLKYKNNSNITVLMAYLKKVYETNDKFGLGILTMKNY